MKFTLAFDSYKDALRSAEVGRAVAEGIRAVLPGAEIVEIFELTGFTEFLVINP